MDSTSNGSGSMSGSMSADEDVALITKNDAGSMLFFFADLAFHKMQTYMPWEPPSPCQRERHCPRVSQSTPCCRDSSLCPHPYCTPLLPEYSQNL